MVNIILNMWSYMSKTHIQPTVSCTLKFEVLFTCKLHENQYSMNNNKFTAYNTRQGCEEMCVCLSFGTMLNSRQLITQQSGWWYKIQTKSCRILILNVNIYHNPCTLLQSVVLRSLNGNCLENLSNFCNISFFQLVTLMYVNWYVRQWLSFTKSRSV